MNLLRIRISLTDRSLQCAWVLAGDGGPAPVGHGPLAALPRGAARVQLILPAAQVLLVRTRLPQAARRHAASVLAYVLEDALAGDPDAVQATWLGTAGGEDVLAVLDKQGLSRWLEALQDAGIRSPEVHVETLLLPSVAGEWSVAWDGREAIVRSGEFEGAATDCGDHATAPLALKLMLDAAARRTESPASLALYLSAAAALPDIEAWQRQLGVPIRSAGTWNWDSASREAGVAVAQRQAWPWRRWRLAPAARARLRPAAWIAGAALAIHALALLVDWTLLAAEQRGIRQSMALRFRDVFPDAVAVVDPVLQMRRKLTEARHAGGLADRTDFLPMIERIAAAAGHLPTGAVRIVTYDAGRMTLELSAVDAAGTRRLLARLRESGLTVDQPAATTPGARLVLTVRAA